MTDSVRRLNVNVNGTLKGEERKNGRSSNIWKDNGWGFSEQISWTGEWMNKV